MNTINASSLQGISETLLIPLYAKSKETKENGIIKDEYACEILDQIDYNFTEISEDWRTHTFTIVRTEILDEIVQKYAGDFKFSTIVNLGAGLDTRHFRFNNYKWYQLDLPDVMNMRKSISTFNDEFTIEKSVLDFSWIQDIDEKENVLIIAEGLLFYLEEDSVKSIFQNIGNNFRNSYFVFDTIPDLSSDARKTSSVKQESAPQKWFNYKLKTIEDWQFGFTEQLKFSMMTRHKNRWKGLRYLHLIPKFKNGFKVAVMKIN